MKLFNKKSKPKNKEKDEKQLGGSFLFEVAKTVIIATAIVLVVRYFLIQPFYVKGASMEPNFYDHEYLVIDELSYRFREPDRGEVVVMRFPRDRAQFFIKRIIGLPGETIDINNNTITLSGGSLVGEIILQEPYLDDEVKTSGSHHMTLGPDEYFLLGDNRNASLDSRVFGVVEESDIIGRTWIRVWPFHRFEFFGDQEYNILP
ncbi:signal peptidase I [Patescibacteria group bacterium]